MHLSAGLSRQGQGPHDPALLGVGPISAANFATVGSAQSAGAKAATVKFMAGNMESLAGTWPERLADEAISHAAAWDFMQDAPGLSLHPLLVITSNDGQGPSNDALAKAVRETGKAPVTVTHLDTDHAYSDQRIALETAVVAWLEGLGASSAASNSLRVEEHGHGA